MQGLRQQRGEFSKNLLNSLPWATEDLLRRGNKMLIPGNDDSEASYLLCYDEEGHTDEYVVESVAYGQSVKEVIADANRMAATEALLKEPGVSRFL